MRIERAQLHLVRIPLKRAFAHAASSRTESEAVLVALHDDAGNVGWGEIRPRPYVTGETIDEVLDVRGPALANALLDGSFEDLGGVIARLSAIEDAAGLATRGGFEAALLDVAGQALGFGLGDVLGGEPGPALPAGVVIGFETSTDKLPRHCAMLRLAGRRHIKVKVGLPDDARRLALVRDVFGRDVPLRLDANAAWSVAETIDNLAAFGDIPIHSIEQPVAKDDLDGLRTIREQTGVRVMADESVCSVADAHALVAARAADIFNIRIGKHGGILAAARIVSLAQDAGIAVHLGTLVGETGILSRISEVFGRMTPGFDCLDGKGQHRFLLLEDVLQPPENNGKEDLGARPVSAPGLGVTVDPDRVARFRVQTPRRFAASAAS
jgi:L-alanine-DL-glutamate epimerase-like enolase superfamily enzyme